MNEKIGSTLQRLRKAYNFSLGDLSEQSGVAKSIISRIEKNETNPTIATMMKLCEALDKPIGDFLTPESYNGDNSDKSSQNTGLIEKAGRGQTPVLVSDDGKCKLVILGWLSSVELVQWYDVRMQIDGVINSEGHPPGSIENITVLEGAVKLETSNQTTLVSKGETARYYGDVAHILTNCHDGETHLSMVNLLPPVARLSQMH